MTRKRRMWIFGIGALLLIAAGVTIPLWLLGSIRSTTATSPDEATCTVTRGDLRQTLVVYGDVAPKQEYTFTFDGDRVNEVLVDVGQRVDEGQVLVELDRRQLELSLLQTERSLKEAEAEGVPSTIREKELQYEIAQANYEDATLRAPFAGVITRMTQPTSSSGDWSLRLIDTSELYIEATVDQLDAPSVAAGQIAEAIVEPLPDQTWTVEVVEVGGMATASGSSTAVSVTAKLPEADPRILVGYTAEMEIITASATDVLIVPITCLQEHPRGWMVIKILGEERTPAQVTVGALSDQYAEITSGLEEGDVILLNSSVAPASRADDTDEQQQEMMRQRMPGGTAPGAAFPGGAP